MKLKSLVFLWMLCTFSWADELPYALKVGDVLFQSCQNPAGLDLVDTIEGATNSAYSHCGIVTQKNDQWFVLEAAYKVMETPLTQWIEKGREKKFWAYRFNEENQKFIPQAILAMKKDVGKNYDIHYSFANDDIYCSELIWRGWKETTGHGLGKAVKLRDLKWQPYQKVIEMIEGKGNIPLDREMITPRDLANAKELSFIYQSPKR